MVIDPTFLFFFMNKFVFCFGDGKALVKGRRSQLSNLTYSVMFIFHLYFTAMCKISDIPLGELCVNRIALNMSAWPSGCVANSTSVSDD